MTMIVSLSVLSGTSETTPVIDVRSSPRRIDSDCLERALNHFRMNRRVLCRHDSERDAGIGFGETGDRRHMLLIFEQREQSFWYHLEPPFVSHRQYHHPQC